MFKHSQRLLFLEISRLNKLCFGHTPVDDGQECTCELFKLTSASPLSLKVKTLTTDNVNQPKQSAGLHFKNECRSKKYVAFLSIFTRELMWNPPFRCSHSTGMMKSLLNLLFRADIKSAGYEMYYAICFTSIILCCIFNDRMYYLQINNHQSNI